MAGAAIDTVVIGAGAAGLAAARALSDGGRDVVVLEARPRIGGRILTVHDPEWPLPVELGPEFLHGEAKPTRDIADAAGIAVVELPDEHVWAEDGRVRPMGEVWTRFAALLRRIPAKGPDVSFERFLAQRRVPAAAREMARLFVEGYFAAHVDRVSAQSVAAGAAESDETQRQYRLAAGYFTVVEWLRAALPPERCRVRLASVVETVAWRRGEVEVGFRSAAGTQVRTLRARTAVVTLPLGVLKAAPPEAGAVRFDPMPGSLRAAIQKLEVSHVESWRAHDWRRDPYSRGAYSYVGVGGLPAQRALGRPCQGTLFFAGDTTEPDEMGTVAGAIASGKRAARQILS